MTPVLSASPASASASPLRRFGWIAAVLIATAIAYAPALRGGFIWDDDAHLTAPGLRSLAGLGRIWSEPGATQQYYPLLHSLFWLEHKLWGDTALGYHIANLILHATTAFLFALVLHRLAIAGALIAALLFALHPMHVESVAWITEQKNTLSTLFNLAATLCYLRFDSEREPRAYGIAFLFFLLGLLTKTVVATLPAALLIVLWWRRGALAWSRDLRPLLSWFVVAAAAGIFTAWIERKLIGAEGAAFDLTLAQRCVLAGRVLWFYAGKIAWPTGLTFFYPRWSPDSGSVHWWLPLLGFIAVTALLVRARQTSRTPVTMLLLFTGSLFPVLGFLNVYPFQFSFVADHFAYLPSLALFACAGAVLARHHAALAIACLAALAALTFQQAKIYRDAPTLYRATLARNPDSWIAHNNLGKELLADKAQLPTAIEHLQRAVALRPNYAEALNNLGLAFTQTGRPREAIPCLERSLRLKPDVYQAHNNLGIALASSGRAEDAVRSFARAAALNPRLPNIHENWAKALQLAGRPTEAEEHFARAAQLRAESR
jgi:tetratricopeptide (TPR) repeat protein